MSSTKIKIKSDEASPQGFSGIPEVSSGILQKQQLRARHGAAPAQTVEEGCERVFCEMLKAVRLGERRFADQNSLAADAPLPAHGGGGGGGHQIRASFTTQALACMEIFDYMVDEHYQGMILMTGNEPCLFVSLAPSIVGKNLKSSLVALMELSSSKEIDCPKLALCVPRTIDASVLASMSRELSWAGFELVTLTELTGSPQATSDEWLFFEAEL